MNFYMYKKVSVTITQVIIALTKQQPEFSLSHPA